MIKYILLFLLTICILSCRNEKDIDPCLEDLKIVSTQQLSDGTIKYEVIGEVRTLSKGYRNIEELVSKVLDISKGVVAGCLVFEENHNNCFGCFMIDRRQSADFSSIKLHEEAKVILQRVALNEEIPKTFKNQKKVKYLYVIQDIESLSRE